MAKNKEIPFYVNTETNQVRVVETHFNVCAYRGSNEFTTTLLEGIVDIYAKGSEHSLTRLGVNEVFISGLIHRRTVSVYLNRTIAIANKSISINIS